MFGCSSRRNVSGIRRRTNCTLENYTSNFDKEMRRTRESYMKTNEIRERYLKFFEKEGHTIIPSASLVPENDPTTLFTGSGMQPMLPYLLGEKHPLGTRIADSQRSFRSGDIEDVGDSRHTTFFEMLGNWSLGDYFKKEQLPWIFSFLMDELKLNPQRFYVTAFIGDKKNGIPKDTESAEIWKNLFAKKGIVATEVEMGTEENAAKIGMHGERIFYYGVKNWWSRVGAPEKMPAGEPGGPDSEMFYEFLHIEHNPKYGQYCHPNCDCGRFIEIGNSVFMEYKKNTDGTFSRLSQQNVDFGGGLERIAMAVQDTSDIIKLDIFNDTISHLEKLSGKKYNDKEYMASFQIIADHLRASVFLIGDGVLPSNTDQGYFVRRLLRRAVRHWDLLSIKNEGLHTLVDSLLEYYKDAYPETYKQKEHIKSEIKKEEEKFRETLQSGLKELEKRMRLGAITGKDMFDLYQSYGFPKELTQEIAQKITNPEQFDEESKKHQDLSRVGSEKKFKGGLADTSDKSLQYHTATHLLNAALRKVLGDHISQKGSNITPERMRFDFAHGAKMTDEEKKKVEDLVNEQINKALPVSWEEMPIEKARELGAIGVFGEKYGDLVKVYTVGDAQHGVFSREMCGGPHVKNTSELGHFKIVKEEAVSAGVRRIKAVLG